jgi:hypothetical protein
MQRQNAKINHKARRACLDNHSNKTSKQLMKQSAGPPEPRADGARMVKYLEIRQRHPPAGRYVWFSQKTTTLPRFTVFYQCGWALGSGIGVIQVIIDFRGVHEVASLGWSFCLQKDIKNSYFFLTFSIIEVMNVLKHNITNPEQREYW